MTTERFTDRIIRHLAHQDYQPQKIRKLARAMRIADEEYGKLGEAVKALMKTGRIVMGSASALTLPDPTRRVEVPTLDECRELGAHCSRNERRAEAAERELKQVYILRLLEQHVGDEFEGIVTGVTNFDVFVQLPRYLI